MYAEDAVIEDPVGPSMFDPDGPGTAGTTASGVLEPGDRADREFRLRHPRLARQRATPAPTSARSRTSFPDGADVDTDLIMVYMVDDDGRVASMRAYWEPERDDGELPPGLDGLDGAPRPLHELVAVARQSLRTRSSSAAVWITGSKPMAWPAMIGLCRSRSIRGWSLS